MRIYSAHLLVLETLLLVATILYLADTMYDENTRTEALEGPYNQSE